MKIESDVKRAAKEVLAFYRVARNVSFECETRVSDEEDGEILRCRINVTYET